LNDRSMRMRPARLRQGHGVIGIFLLLWIMSPPALAQDDGPPGRTAPSSGTTAWFGSHHRRNACRDLDAGARAHRAVLRVFPQGG
jgi:hypothetical protein